MIDHNDLKDNNGRTVDDEGEAISKHDCVDVKQVYEGSISSLLTHCSSS